MVDYRARVLRPDAETGGFRVVGFYRKYPPGVVDGAGRYIGPGFDDDRLEFGRIAVIDDGGE